MGSKKTKQRTVRYSNYYFKILPFVVVCYSAIDTEVGIWHHDNCVTSSETGRGKKTVIGAERADGRQNNGLQKCPHPNLQNL